MPVQSIKASLAYEIGTTLGEGPVWDEIGEKLYWVDIMSGMVYIYDPKENSNKGFKIDGHVGAVALREKGGFVMVTENGFAFINLESQEITPIADPESNIPGNRFNDGKCDPYGRFWAGTMAYKEERGAGGLYCLNPDLSVEVKLKNVSISNGLAWNKNQDKFFYIDTTEQKVFSFDYNYKTGEISGKTIIREINNRIGFPDGMTIDEQDHLWIALYGGGKVIRVNPQNGDTVFEVKLPVPKPTSCTFGGKELNELFITTCRDDMSQSDIEQAPLSGSLFKVKLPYKGLPAYRFAG